jgi:HD-GYP domain-containing protein (c-di-GMP phosphodiesterase class II)
MLKRIEASEVRLGMYIHKLEGPWLSHPFWKTKFLLTDPARLAKLHDSDVEGVLIDVSKGADVERPDRPAPAPAPARPAGFGRAAPRPLAYRPTPRPAPEPAFDPLSRTPRTAAKEFGTAAKLANRSKKLMQSVFAEARLGRAVKIDKLEPLVEEISCSVLRNPHAFATLSRMKKDDEFTYMHSVAVCALMMNLARQLDLSVDQQREAGLAGLLMDMGTAEIPSHILYKPGELTPEEQRVMQSHVLIGHQLMTQGGALSDAVMDVCLHHHERVDGSGYPDGLMGADISLFARMAAICDTYDAMTSNRPHRAGQDPADVLAQMAEMPGQFDSEVFSAFVRGMGIYPITSLVRLRSDRLAVVVEQNRDDYTLPVVRTFHSATLHKRVPFEDINLAACYGRDEIVSREHPSSWNLEPWQPICARVIGSGFRV